MNNFLKKDYEKVLDAPTHELIEGCINSLRDSMRFVGRLHVQEGSCYRSKSLNHKLNRLIKLMAFYIIKLQRFQSKLKERV